MTEKEHIMNTLRSKGSELKAFGISSVGLFGSFLRGDQSENSDIDVLVDFEPGRETFDNFMAVCDLLEGLFKDRKVDIVTKNGLSPYIGPKVLNEVSYV